ncbi:co-chaperone YbbN [uncultured Methanobrevibacter sp.]|uniref:thioredoxin family protein n=1 Tax=uncultured Methanobrevibacter sp. TaxID=253161 RepID=UPI0025F9EDD0|nr:thioredoxin family protein [uncultured Methanobrevibacter sp.]MBR4590162.1 thioredoxin family protein [Bacteroidaceae bacterium]
MIYITDENWNNGEIVSNGGLMVIKVSATWCGPCNTYKPVFEEVAKNNTDESIQFAEADADENDELIAAAGVRGVPTTLIYNKGNLVAKKAGFIDSETLTKLINEAK